MSVDEYVENDNCIQLLDRCVQDGLMGLNEAPKILKEVLTNDRWKARRIRTGEIVSFNTFQEFVTTPRIKGLGTTVEMIDRIASVDSELPTLVAVAKTQPHGGSYNTKRTNQYTPKDVLDDDNIIIEQRVSPTGTSAQQARVRLFRQAPELHARVLAGELSPHAAMIQAGFRKKTMTLPCDVESLAARLAKIYDLSNLTELVTRLLLTIEDAKNKGECV